MSEEVIYPIEPVYTGTSRGTITITDPIDASAAAANKSQTGENLRIPFRFRNGKTILIFLRIIKADYLFNIFKETSITRLTHNIYCIAQQTPITDVGHQ
jgi:hypothetical protein